MNKLHKLLAGLLAAGLCVVVPVSAAADTTVTLTYGTPPSGQDNTFTVVCGFSTPVPTLGTYDLNLYYDSSKARFESVEDLAGFTGINGDNAGGGGGFGTCDSNVNVYFYTSDTVSNVTSLFRATFTQLQPSTVNIYMYMADYPGLDGLWEGPWSQNPIAHSFAADNKYLPVSVSGFAVE